LPLAASTAFLNSTTVQQNQIVADLVAAETSCKGAVTVTGSTHCHELLGVPDEEQINVVLFVKEN
jgi:hypothetical protein